MSALPTVTTKNITLNVNATVLASTLISTVSSPTNLFISKYDFQDQGGDGGYFSLNGVKQADGVWITVTAYNLPNLTYTAGSTNGTEQLFVGVYDVQWSNAVALIETTKALALPLITASNISIYVNSAIQISNLIKSVSDPNNLPITLYAFRDSGGSGGYLSVNGAAQANNTWVPVTSDNLSSLQYVSGSSTGTDKVDMQVWDDQWSYFSTSTVTINPLPLPTITVLDQKLNVNAVILASNFISSVQNPNNLSTIAYDFQSSGTDGGYFILNGVNQPAKTWITIYSADLNNLVYFAGSTNGVDSVLVASNDGQWSKAVASNVTVNALALPILTTNDLILNTASSVNASKFIRTIADPNNLPILYYEFRDEGGSNGYFLLNNVKQVANTWIQVSSANLNNLTYVSGAAGGSEIIDIKIFDDQWSINQISNVTTTLSSSNITSTIKPLVGSYLAQGSEKISLTSLFNISSSLNNPKYLDVTLLDRLEYPFLIDPTSGYLITSSGITDPMISTKLLSYYFGTRTSDGKELGVVFTYDTASGRYFNQSYGFLDQISYVSSPFQNDNTYVSVFSTNDVNVILAIENDPNISFMDPVALGAYAANNNMVYNGTVDVVTRNDLNIIAPNHATPNSIVSSAYSFNGQLWNHNGCWVLASNISARAGASLPITSSGGAVSLYTGENTGKPISNGEWIVAYYGGNYTNPSLADVYKMIKPGDIVTMFGTKSGHITTIVSGSGSSAMTFDNTTSIYTQVDANDVILGSNSSISQEFIGLGVPASRVTIYRLDTPTIAVNTPILNCLSSDTVSLSKYIATTDAGGVGLLPILRYAVYDVPSAGGSNGLFNVGGSAKAATSQNLLYLNASDLATLTFQPPSATSSDKVLISAYNGSYWGDWASLNININSGFIDTYDGTYLVIPQLTNGTNTYSNVVVTVSNIVSVFLGTPAGSQDVYNPSNNQLAIQTVTAYGNTYTNVVITIGVIQSINGQPIHSFN